MPGDSNVWSLRADWASITISKAPRNTPTSMFENQSSSCARPSSGSSTKSARGFSSKIKENCLLSLDQFVIVGVIFRKILKPTYKLCVSFYPFLARLDRESPLRSSPRLPGSLSRPVRSIWQGNLQSVAFQYCNPSYPTVY